MRLARKGIFFCLVGPTGSGKSSIGKEIVTQREDILTSVSVTSRAPRVGEQDGVHYHFVDRREFERRQSAGLLFEAEEVHGNYYGTLQQTIDNVVTGENDLLLDIDIRGALTFQKLFPEQTTIVFLSPPDAESLIARVRGRGEVRDEELHARIRTAADEFSALDQALRAIPCPVRYLIVNRGFHESVQRTLAILDAERVVVARLAPERIQSLSTIAMKAKTILETSS